MKILHLKNQIQKGLEHLNEYDNSKELYNLENDPNELKNIAGSGLKIEGMLLKELNKLQNEIL